MAEITLKEAKEFYNSSPKEAKAFLLTKFTKDELEAKTPTQEEFNKFFEDNIYTLIDYSKTKFFKNVFLDGIGYYSVVSKIPTSTIELRNSKDKWLFNYNYDHDQKNQHFYYSYNRVYNIINEQFSLKDIEFEKYMKIIVEKYFNLPNILPKFIIIL